MQAQTATVKSVLGCKPWDGPKGKVFYHTLELDNGVVGQIGKKRENAFAAGDKLTYELEETDRGNRLKEILPNGNGFKSGGFRGSDASFALSYAKDLTVSLIAKNEKAITSAEAADVTITVANRLLAWMKANA